MSTTPQPPNPTATPTRSATSSPAQTIRDGLLFLAGLGGMVHQTLVVMEPKPILIGAFLLMLGLPVSLLTDRLFQRPAALSATPPPPPVPPSPPNTPAPPTA